MTYFVSGYSKSDKRHVVKVVPRNKLDGIVPFISSFPIYIYFKIFFFFHHILITLSLRHIETLEDLKPVTSQHVFSVGPAVLPKDHSLIVAAHLDQTKKWAQYPLRSSLEY